MSSRFLLIGKDREARWPKYIRESLADIGWLDVVTEQEALPSISMKHYDAIIIDAGEVEDVIQLIKHFRTRRVHAPIIVATAAPSWQRARQAMMAGATDYIVKSLDKSELRNNIKTVMRLKRIE